jgi:hypothetical protein
MSPSILLAQVVSALERTSRLQHQLARRAAFLRGVALDLRLGGNPDVAAVRITKEIRNGLDLKVEANA